MRIHNYGNDYVQAKKFKEVDNAGNRVAENEPTASGEARSENTEAKEEGAKTKKANKKKGQNSSDNL